LTDTWKELALEQVFYYMDTNNSANKYELINTNYDWAINLSWENQAAKLLDTYILPNGILEYKGMYNWTNDIPFGSKSIFLQIINDFNQNYHKVKSNDRIIVLEIGSYTGISLINIVNAIPNSVGIGIDMWSSYNENSLLENMDALQVEQSFYKNVSSAGLKDRIIGIKSASTNKLLEYIRQGFKADFIYVDGSHLLLDCYTDLVLSWEILETDGILAIDDYLYKNDEILNSPFEAVNHFLKTYDGKYVLLDINYRVFLKKVF
jgi:predicted O-methyltransferase YrrM